MNNNYELVLTMKPITTKEHACAPNTPMDLWLPYEHVLSERYICEENGAVYERFQEIAVLSENEENPDDDLETEMLKLPEALVAWNTTGTLTAGATIRVKGCDGHIIFEEKVTGTRRLGRLHYFVAERRAPLLTDSYSKLEHELRFAGSFWNRDPKRLAEDSTGPVVLKSNVRGSIYVVTLQQLVVQDSFFAYPRTKEGSEKRTFRVGERVTRATASIGGGHMVTYIVACPLAEAARKLQPALMRGYDN